MGTGCLWRVGPQKILWTRGGSLQAPCRSRTSQAPNSRWAACALTDMRTTICLQGFLIDVPKGSHALRERDLFMLLLLKKLRKWHYLLMARAFSMADSSRKLSM